LTNFAISTIEGSVVDPTGRALSSIRIGVVYDWGTVSAPGVVPLAAAPGLPGPTADEVVLGDPYPNPVAAPPGAVQLWILADGDTTIRLEIWTEVGGVGTLVASLHSGTITPGPHSWQWEGRDDFSAEPVPNGMYTVRLTVPASGEPNTRTEKNLLVNRSLVQMEALDPFGEGLGFNGLSGADGTFLLSDIAVGQSFLITNPDSPDPIANGITRNQVTLYFSDPDFQSAKRDVPIGAGDVVTVAPVTLTPIFPAPAP
jgi:hypothetical protein